MHQLASLAATLLLALTSAGQTRLPVTEKVEWTWTDRPEMASPALPNVLLVGDSITRAYYPEVARQLAREANVYLFATSASSGDPRLPQQLGDYFRMMGLTFTAIHFNNGMHGWGYTEAQYDAGLPGMIAALRAGAPKANLVWANTTPVLHDSKTGESTNARIDERNRLAAACMAGEGIPIEDQHGLMLPHPELHDGDVHFIAAGSALQATRVAAVLRTLFPKQFPPATALSP
jgi:GDSL-like Lipase/Acylhydrolase family